MPQQKYAAKEKQMENQDSTNKKTFKLSRRKKVIIGSIVALLLLGMVGRGMAFRGGRERMGNYPSGRTGSLMVAAKDFESMGIVFAESASALRDGYRATYNELMKEAAQKGADAIINVNISSSGYFFNRKWSGSATAIKYLDTISGEIDTTALLIRGGRGFERNWF